MPKWGQSSQHDMPAGEISTLVGKDADIQGSIKTKGSIRVDGAIAGELVSSKTVTIGPTGSVEGNVAAEHIIIAGRVKGNLKAGGKIALESSARFEGDLHTVRLSIAEGAAFIGRSTMGEAQHPGRHLDLKSDGSSLPADKKVAVA